MSIPHDIKPEYDVVFAGGGTAACITASRLATQFPELTFAVLESGPTTEGKKEHIAPAYYMSHLAPTSKAAQFVVSKPSPDVADRSIIIPTGHCVGGGSSINFMLYNRPAASDFDDWEKDFSNPGWGARELIPLLANAETYEIDPSMPTHGKDGPLKASYGSTVFDIGKEFLEYGPKFEKDRPLGTDGNGFYEWSVNRFYQMPKWISKSGRRSDVPHHYVFNKKWSNLFILDGILVNRVVVEDGTAKSVEYLFDNRVHADAPQDIRAVSAKKLVVVAAGAMNSPLILERSGIGRKDVLEKAGIPIVQELDGVGENYQDHYFLVSPYIADPETTTYDKIFRNDADLWKEMTEAWEKDGSGLMATNGVDAALKLRPLEQELAEVGPDFEARWKKFYANKPDKPLFWLSALGGLPADQSALPPLNFFCSGCFLAYPASRGSIHSESTDPYAPADFQSGFLSDYSDVVALRWGYKRGMELMRRHPRFRGFLAPVHPQFSGKSASEALSASSPTPLDAPRIEFTAEDDKAIDANIRQWVGTTWHSLGTCAMKPQAEGGVVDSKLNVYGVKALKVADLSIPPENVNGNTYAAAVTVGEKAALIIAAELKV